MEKGHVSTFSAAVVKDTSKVITSISNTYNFIKSYKIKRVPFRRFNNEVCVAAVNDCISSIESEFKHIVIANRSALYRNFVDTTMTSRRQYIES